MTAAMPSRCDWPAAWRQTITEAGDDVPPLLLAVTVNDEVVVILVDTTDVVLPATPGPVQLNVAGAPPAPQLAVKVTEPPPEGSDDGDEITLQLLGGARTPVTVITTSFVLVRNP
jgi:hypothetical protein